MILDPNFGLVVRFSYQYILAVGNRRWYVAGNGIIEIPGT